MFDITVTKKNAPASELNTMDYGNLKGFVLVTFSDSDKFADSTNVLHRASAKPDMN